MCGYRLLMECSRAQPLIWSSLFICLRLQGHVYSANPNLGHVAREDYMNPSKWDGWLKFLKYFDLWGQENDRILETLRLVVVKTWGLPCAVHQAWGTAPVGGCLLSSPLRQAAQASRRRRGCRAQTARAGSGLPKQGPFSLGPSHPFGFLSMGCAFGGKTES